MRKIILLAALLTGCLDDSSDCSDLIAVDGTVAGAPTCSKHASAPSCHACIGDACADLARTCADEYPSPGALATPFICDAGVDAFDWALGVADVMWCGTSSRVSLCCARLDEI